MEEEDIVGEFIVVMDFVREMFEDERERRMRNKLSGKYKISLNLMRYIGFADTFTVSNYSICMSFAFNPLFFFIRTKFIRTLLRFGGILRTF